MSLTITKEKVLEAASKCSVAKATLEVLFPEAFQVPDNLAIKKHVNKQEVDDHFNNASEKLGLEEYSICIADGSAESGKYHRQFILQWYKWEFKEISDGYLLTAYKK